MAKPVGHPWEGVLVAPHIPWNLNLEAVGLVVD
jgi:hypothetical protein